MIENSTINKANENSSISSRIRQKRRRSKQAELGIASVAAWFISAFIFVAAIAVYMIADARATSAGLTTDIEAPILSVLAFFFAFAGHVIGVVTGGLGFVQKTRKHDFCVAGLAMNIIALLFILVLLIS